VIAGRWIAAVLLLLTACGASLTDELQQVRTFCPYERVLSLADERACEARRRALIAEHGERPHRWHESLWAFRRLVAEKRDAGAISPAEADFAVTDYQRRLEIEAHQLGAAQDAARATEMGNYLRIWRGYFPNR
jgi:hypothetical protein